MGQDMPSILSLFHPYYPVKLQGKSSIDTAILLHILRQAIKGAGENPCLRGFLSQFSTASPGQTKQQYCILHSVSLAVYNTISEVSQIYHTSIPIGKQDCDITYDDARELITLAPTIETAAESDRR